MIILTNTTSLEIKLGSSTATSQLPFYVAYVDSTSTTYTPTQLNGITNNTFIVSLINSPSSGVSRVIKYISIHNEDTVASQIILQINDGSNTRKLIDFTLDAGDRLEYTDTVGFRVLTSAGEIKLGSGGGSWGTIMGTLSSQTDLQGALDSKVDKVTGSRLITSSESTLLSNTSGNNSGDNAENSLYSSLVSNATHTGEVTGSTVLTLDKTAITNKATVTVAHDDYVLISDTSDSGNLKKALKSDFGGGSSSLSGLTAATATNTINNGAYSQEWQFNSLANGTGLKLSSNSTLASSNFQSIFEIANSGANATSTQTTYGAKIANTKTGTSATNVALQLSATGATNNYGLIVSNGNVGIGTNAPSAKLEVRGTSDFWGLQVGNGTVGALFQVSAGNAGFVGFNGSGYNSLDIRSGVNTQLFLATNGNVGIGTTSPNASAKLEISSTVSGFLPPRMTTTQKNAISSLVEGLEVYDLTLHQKSYYNGTTWINY